MFDPETYSQIVLHDNSSDEKLVGYMYACVLQLVGGVNWLVVLNPLVLDPFDGVFNGSC